MLEGSREAGLMQRAHSIRLCLATRMRGKIIICWVVINPLKMWQSLNIWEQQ